MGPVLTQHEIDKLFQQAREKRTEEVLPESLPAFYKYDFRAEQKIGGERKRTLQALHGFFMRLATSTIGTLMRSSPQMSLAAVNQLTYADYLEAAPSPGCFYIAKVNELDENFVIDLALPIAYSVVDRLLGGPGEPPGFGSRELSEIEQKVVSRFVGSLLEDLEKAWGKFHELHFEIKGSAGDPEFIQLVAPTEAVIIVSVAVRLNEVEDFLNFVFPASLLEKGLPRSDAAYLRSLRRKEADDFDQEIVRQQMNEVPVPLTARLGRTVISFEDLMQLECGDVLRLDRLVQEPVDLVVGEETRFRAAPGLHRGHRAVKVLVDVMEEEEEKQVEEEDEETEAELAA